MLQNLPVEYRSIEVKDGVTLETAWVLVALFPSGFFGLARGKTNGSVAKQNRVSPERRNSDLTERRNQGGELSWKPQ